jgi:GNAT superfamily N-acetyltransferase
MNENMITIRNAKPDEFVSIGKLMVDAYSGLEGFPGPEEMPAYYDMLRNVGELTKKPSTELLVAISPTGGVLGAVVYFGDIQQYGANITAAGEKNASGFRLLAVDAAARGQGVGKLLVNGCIQKAKERGHDQVILHTTKSMQTAWKMYEAMGFKSSKDLDFSQGGVDVFGFRLKL